jgi:hypothetical protein
MPKQTIFRALTALAASITAAGMMSTTTLAASPTASNAMPPIDSRVYSCDHLFKDASNKAVLLILGDSAIARGRLESAPGHVRLFSRNPINGLCYPSGNNMPGIVGSEASPWIRTANLLLEKNLRERILLVPLLVERSDIAAWRPDTGSIGARLNALVDAINALKLPVDAIIWQHGQGNDATLKEPQDYVDTIKSVLQTMRTKGITAPMIVAPTGNCPGSQEGAVRAAQTLIIQSLPGVIAGPRLGNFGAEYFHPDGCALNQLGLERYAQAWAELLRQQLSGNKP